MYYIIEMKHVSSYLLALYLLLILQQQQYTHVMIVTMITKASTHITIRRIW